MTTQNQILTRLRPATLRPSRTGENRGPYLAHPQLRRGTAAHYLREHAGDVELPRVLTVREWSLVNDNLIEHIRVEFLDGRPSETHSTEHTSRELAAREFPPGSQIYAIAWGHDEHGKPCLSWHTELTL